MATVAAVEFSAEREVRALGWAVRFIHAASVHDEGTAFHEVEIAYYDELKARNDPADMRALMYAFSRIGSGLALSAGISGESREDALRRTYNALAQTSIEYDPDDPWGWLDELEDDDGAENAEEQLRYLRGEDDEPAAPA